MRLTLVGLLLGLLSVVSALSAAGSSLLVVIEEEADKAKYSQFWSSLQDRGFQITYKAPKDTSLSLFQHGEPAYSHLLLLPTKAKGLGPALTPNLLVEFINSGSNILLTLAGDHSVPTSVNSLLSELDIALPADRTTVVVDHQAYDVKSAAKTHDVLLLKSPERRRDVVDYFKVDGLIAFPRAVGQVLGNASPLLSSIIKADSAAYVHNPKEDADAREEPFATGSQINIVSSFQARNSARFTVLGSAEALQDEWFDATVQLPVSGEKLQNTANREFARRLSEWTFKEIGVLKVDKVQHSLVDDTVDLNPKIYRVKNDVQYSIELSEWAVDEWIPYNPPTGDNVQLEFSMLSPFHRLNLIPSASKADSKAMSFNTSFRCPDQHGIFNFYVEYRRPFLTNIEDKQTVTVRHFAHDEFPRSFAISGAWPWITGIWVTIGGWVVFVALWLYSKPVRSSKPASAKK